jgi:NAD(P)-dependent dehydrogenase (short-subunit alcohol dehydrogenase family)
MKNSQARIVLITGATRGLGAEVAAQLSRSGHVVLLGGRKAGALQAQVESIRAAGGEAQALALDVTDSASIAAAARELERRFERLDVLVNNAGVMLDGAWVGNTAASIDLRTLRSTFETNLFAVVAVTHAFLPLLRRGKDPHVVNVSSVMGSSTVHADPNGPLDAVKPFAYDASKAALNSFTVHLAAALRPDAIRVNSVHPGWIRTELGTADAPLGIEEGARAIVAVAASVGGTPTAKFLHVDGELPW